jgi:hypothetical protein
VNIVWQNERQRQQRYTTKIPIQTFSTTLLLFKVSIFV